MFKPPIIQLFGLALVTLFIALCVLTFFLRAALLSQGRFLLRICLGLRLHRLSRRKWSLKCVLLVIKVYNYRNFFAFSFFIALRLA